MFDPTLNGVMAQIEAAKIVLPAMQRPFVWKDDRITKLIDSMLRGFPLGTALLWKTSTMQRFRRFQKDVQPDAGITVDFDSDDSTERYLVLDGQQRLTSLFVALTGPWRGNLRDLLVSHEGCDLVEALLQRLDLAADEARHVTLAIDTPLAWPRRMLEFVTVGTSIDVPAEADQNPYLFGMQELALFAHDQRPLSVVRDMIGSQSTKGIHFLHRAQLSPTAVGVWGHGSTTAIETYPAAAIADLEVARLSASLLTGLLGQEKKARNDAWQGDVRDAITCALVAMLHRQHPERLEAPGPDAEPAEGWIWLPRANVVTA